MHFILGFVYIMVVIYIYSRMLLSYNAVMQTVVYHKTKKSFGETSHFLETIMVKCCHYLARTLETSMERERGPYTILWLYCHMHMSEKRVMVKHCGE